MLYTITDKTQTTQRAFDAIPCDVLTQLAFGGVVSSAEITHYYTHTLQQLVPRISIHSPDRGPGRHLA